jgi:hypothetical protein
MNAHDNRVEWHGCVGKRPGLRKRAGDGRVRSGQARPGPCFLTGVSLEAPGSSMTCRGKWPVTWVGVAGFEPALKIPGHLRFRRLSAVGRWP